MSTTKREPASVQADFERFRAICATAGVDVDKLSSELVERMQLLAETTETVADCQRAAEMAQEVFRYYEREKPAQRFSELDQRTVLMASLFSDVGKTGPAQADRAAQLLIAEMFSVERVPDENMPVADFFGAYFPEDAGERTLRFRALGLDPDISMREFWNMHSAWTLHIISPLARPRARFDQVGGIPIEAVAAAATHHLLENVNPDSIVAHDGRFTRYFGENSRVDRPEKLVILLDKYDAARRRAGRSHEDAIHWLRALIAKNARFATDQEFFSLIDDIDVVMGERESAA
jgi:hypothetical protein